MEISVSDDGPGIPDEAKKHLFDLFYTAEQGKPDSKRGLGLGLHLCQSIVNAHGGTITVSDHAPSGDNLPVHPARSSDRRREMSVQDGGFSLMFC